ncbi:MAG: acyl carrier protein [Alistipes sp.]|nr:acyl carrier protein [Candidatus Alistipes equi]
MAEIQQQVAEQVTKIIAEKQGIKASDITLDATFTSLGIDSLDRVELLMDFEKAFDFQSEQEEAEKIATVGDAVDYIVAHLNK